jgi:hypothetical protein
MAARMNTTNAKELGALLHRSHNTVRNQFAHILEILGVDRREKAVWLALDCGWVGREIPVREAPPSAWYLR